MPTPSSSGWRAAACSARLGRARGSLRSAADPRGGGAQRRRRAGDRRRSLRQPADPLGALPVQPARCRWPGPRRSQSGSAARSPIRPGLRPRAGPTRSPSPRTTPPRGAQPTGASRSCWCRRTGNDAARCSARHRLVDRHQLIIIALVLSACLWFLGAFLGFGNTRPFESLIGRLIGIAALWIIALITILVILLRRQKRDQGPGRGDRQHGRARRGQGRAGEGRPRRHARQAQARRWPSCASRSSGRGTCTSCPGTS